MSKPVRVLIVEDEPLISMMLEDMLDSLGKTAIGPADSVSAALELIDAEAIDAAILDVNLRGGERSTPVAEALAERAIPFVFASGGSGEGVDPRFQDRYQLDKPFTFEGVGKALDALG